MDDYDIRFNRVKKYAAELNQHENVVNVLDVIKIIVPYKKGIDHI